MAAEEQVRRWMKELEPLFLRDFRWLHENPELSFREFQTTAYIRKEWKRWGWRFWIPVWRQDWRHF